MQIQQKKYAERAYAKINLALDILGVRENGYHELDMVMQQVSLYDELTLEVFSEDSQGEKQGNRKKEAFETAVFMKSRPNIYYQIDKKELADPELDLGCRALKLLFEEFHIKEKVLLSVKKRIPVAAGLAGGSADAAAALKLANRAFQLGLTTKQLCERGKRLGADVPYCILGGTARAGGIGELLTPLPEPEGILVLLVKPDYNVSTAWVYGEYDKKGVKNHPAVGQMVSCLEQGAVGSLPGLLGNVLENVTIPEYPVIDTIKQRMCLLGAKNAMMSGSGPTVFGLFTDRNAAEAAAAAFQRDGYSEVYLTEPIGTKRQGRIE